MRSSSDLRSRPSDLRPQTSDLGPQTSDPDLGPQTSLTCFCFLFFYHYLFAPFCPLGFWDLFVVFVVPQTTITRKHKSTQTHTNTTLWYQHCRPTNTMLPHDGPEYDVVSEPGPASHTTSLRARILHIVTGPAIEVRGQGVS